MGISFRIVIACIALLLPAISYSASNEMGRDHAIKLFYTEETDHLTCLRVKQFGKGAVSESDCKAQLKDANSFCKSFIKENLPENITEQEGILVMQIITTCSFSKILGYPYAIVEGKPRIIFPQ